ncbi:methionine ABC transporter permease [Candidatus Paracaedibacter symbiosus]|uniref:methionine ABC transporter permease n=1 Tax=Candidatus Paracaedibacter symbiosus TaxID=244582 RepID=UPI000509F18C|nr:methionine ABC transporter permease [Candidatus Paracaedibacter symbiosus]
MLDLLLNSLYETLLMVSASSFFSILLGVPLALLLVVTSKGGLYPHAFLCHMANFMVNAVRSIPYIILTVLIMPFTRLLVGTSIGTWAAIVPLSIAGLLLVARVAEEAMRQVPRGLIEVGLAAGASRWQIIQSILLSEAMPSLMAGVTTVIVNIIGFSAMAGAVGGGGLGDLAIRYGYQRYDLQLVLIIVLILIAMVQLVQVVGNRIVRRMSK